MAECKGKFVSTA